MNSILLLGCLLSSVGLSIYSTAKTKSPDYYSYTISLNIGDRLIPTSLFFYVKFFNYCIAKLCACFHINFRISLYIFIEKSCWNFHRNYVKSVCQFGELTSLVCWVFQSMNSVYSPAILGSSHFFHQNFIVSFIQILNMFYQVCN